MVCYRPLEGYRTPGGQLAFAKRHGYSDLPVTVACGQCIGCRLERSRQWAIRIMHEASLYESNVFLTLTYRDEDLPSNGSLVLEHTQKFMKRLRKKYTGRKIRFYSCGEYGETTGRPHYHSILFNHDFEDKKYLKSTENDHRIYTSEILDKIWSHGDCYIGSVTFESAAYCGRYVMKKLTGAREAEYGDLVPEFQTFSRNPGVGAPWLHKYKTDVFPNDFCVVNGQKVRVPSYYDEKLKEPLIGTWVVDDKDPKYKSFYPSLQRTPTELRKAKRLRSALKHSEDNTPERLAVREELQQRRIERLSRNY